MCPILAAPRDLPVSDRVEGGESQIRLYAAQLGASSDSQDPAMTLSSAESMSSTASNLKSSNVSSQSWT